MTSRGPLPPDLGPPFGARLLLATVLPLAGACTLENPGFIETATGTASTTGSPSATTIPGEPTATSTSGGETSESTTSVSSSSEPSSSESEPTSAGTTSAGTTSAGTTSDERPACEPEAPAKPAFDLTLAPSFADYRAYDLGTVPGIPNNHRFGGATLSSADNDTLLVASESEEPTGKIYAIAVVRGECGHIVGFEGNAAKIADTPFVGAALAFEASGVLFYNLHPNNSIAQLLPGSNAPDREIDLKPLEIQPKPGGLGFVPGGFGDPGGLRVISWDTGEWYQVSLVLDDPLFNLIEAKHTATLPKDSGGFAYVPAGSPGFNGPQVLVAEWTEDRVATYAVNGDGDPEVESRMEFLTAAPRPSGLHFDPVTGDLLLLTWDAEPDRIFVIQGFAAPDA